MQCRNEVTFKKNIIKLKSSDSKGLRFGGLELERNQDLIELIQASWKGTLTRKCYDSK